MSMGMSMGGIGMGGMGMNMPNMAPLGGSRPSRSDCVVSPMSTATTTTSDTSGTGSPANSLRSLSASSGGSMSGSGGEWRSGDYDGEARLDPPGCIWERIPVQ